MCEGGTGGRCRPPAMDSHPRTPRLRQTGCDGGRFHLYTCHLKAPKRGCLSYACIQAAPLQLLGHCPPLQLFPKPEWSGAPTLFLTWVMFEKHAAHRSKLHVGRNPYCLQVSSQKMEHSCLPCSTVQARTAGPSLAPTF